MIIRESFEQWLKARGITPQYTCDGEYSDHDVRIMWEAWYTASLLERMVGYVEAMQEAKMAKEKE